MTIQNILRDVDEPKAEDIYAALSYAANKDRKFISSQLEALTSFQIKIKHQIIHTFEMTFWAF